MPNIFRYFNSSGTFAGRNKSKWAQAVRAAQTENFAMKHNSLRRPPQRFHTRYNVKRINVEALVSAAYNTCQKQQRGTLSYELKGGNLCKQWILPRERGCTSPGKRSAIGSFCTSSRVCCVKAISRYSRSELSAVPRKIPSLHVFWL